MPDYRKLMDRLLELPACTLLTTGRTGTDFLQSLLDSHPEVLTFNGALFYHKFWRTSVCVAAGSFDTGDLMDEFIGRHIEKLKSRYDILERKERLGEDGNQSLNIDPGRFKSEAMALLNGRKIDSKNSMIAVYAAYAICLGQDIGKKTVLFHHQHHFEELDHYLRDFPQSRIICMTRDPRANFVSGVEHWREFDPNTDQEDHLYRYIKRILADASPLRKYKNGYTVIRIEDLGKECLLRELAGWLGISYSESMKRSTWGGLSWGGDRLSAAKNTGTGWSGKMLQNKWEEKLNLTDKRILNYIMFNRLRHYGYTHKRINLIDSLIIPFLILLPLSYELRFFSFRYIRDNLKNGHHRRIIKNMEFYLKRIFLFMGYYLKVLRGEKFYEPVLTCKTEKGGSDGSA
jgi:hypothetical protein